MEETGVTRVSLALHTWGYWPTDNVRRQNSVVGSQQARRSGASVSVVFVETPESVYGDNKKIFPRIAQRTLILKRRRLSNVWWILGLAWLRSVAYITPFIVQMLVLFLYVVGRNISDVFRGVRQGSIRGFTVGVFRLPDRNVVQYTCECDRSVDSLHNEILDCYCKFYRTTDLLFSTEHMWWRKLR